MLGKILTEDFDGGLQILWGQSVKGKKSKSVSNLTIEL